MFATVHKLFQEWNDRIKSDESTPTTTAIPPSVSVPSSTTNDSTGLDKNSQNTLNTILYSNMRYRKQDIPTNFEVNEDTGAIHDVNILPKMTPFTSDKTSLQEMTVYDDTLITNWSKTPKSTKYKLVCSFIDDQSDMCDDKKQHIKRMFRSNFDKYASCIQFDHKSKQISHIDFNNPMFQ